MLKLNGSRKLKSFLPIISFFVSNLIVSCGEDKKKPKEGEEYLIIPYVLGDPSKIEGGSDTVKFTITGTQNNKASLTGGEFFGKLSIDAANRSFTKDQISDLELDHSLRTLINRFDPEKGYYQGEWFWTLAKRVDQALMRQHLLGNESNQILESPAFTEEKSQKYWESNERIGPVEAHYLSELRIETPNLTHSFNSSASIPVKESFTKVNLTAGSCPKVGENVYIPNAESPSEVTTTKVPVGGSVEGADFCIVYLAQPVSEPNKDNIKKSIETILKVYKKVVYKSEFETTSSGFVFKPIIVILDFKDSTKWPSSAAYQVDGVFAPIPTNAAKQPMLYMHSDLVTMKAREADLAKKLFHSTMAHEFQHAIMNYYRVQKTDGVLETPSIDEGLAHFMEDLFGFGEENFGGFTKTFLDVWSETFPPAIHSSKSDAVERGGAQALWYYLVSQKGGVSFSDGVASGGDGLKYIADVVTNQKTKGPKGLADKFGGDWSVTMGEFFVALAVDNMKIPEPNDKFKVAEPLAMKDLLGNTKKFGMRYNGFGGLPASRNFTERKFQSGVALDDLTFYSAVPLLYEITDPNLDVSFKTSTDQGTVSVSRVRIK